MIGIFDSGVGGMTVANDIEKHLPAYRLIYFGDLARTPYGSKSRETIIEYSIQNTEFLLAQGAKVIIIACNSAASVASSILKEKFDVPIFEVITPAVLKAIETTISGRIGVIGTRATIRSGIYEDEIRQRRPEYKVFSQSCPLLVPFVEEGWADSREAKMVLRKYLHPLKLKQIDTLVLGCTHYPLMKELIAHRIGKNKVKLIDSSEEVTASLKAFLEKEQAFSNDLAKNGENIYYVSDLTEAAWSIARHIFGREINLIKV